MIFFSFWTVNLSLSMLLMVAETRQRKDRDESNEYVFPDDGSFDIRESSDTSNSANLKLEKDDNDLKSCMEDKDCKRGKICSKGKCISREVNQEKPQDRCLSNKDCETGFVCKERVCNEEEEKGFEEKELSNENHKLSQKKCDHNSECDHGFVCTHWKVCMTSDETQCRVNSDCPSTDVCQQGRCQNPQENRLKEKIQKIPLRRIFGKIMHSRILPAIQLNIANSLKRFNFASLLPIKYIRHKLFKIIKKTVMNSSEESEEERRGSNLKRKKPDF